jgi:small neutral amino acid transporter SnatA (MarC family)
MDKELLKILPLAITAAVNPTGMCVLMAVLAKSKKTAFALTVAFSLVFVAFGVAVVGFGLKVSTGQHSTLSPVIDLVAAVLVAILGVRSIRRQKKATADDGEGSGGRFAHLGAPAGFVAGLGLAITDVTSLIPYGVALKDLTLAALSAVDEAIIIAVFLAIALAPMWLPVIVALAFPQAADKVLRPLERMLTRHGDRIMGVVCLVLAAYLAVKGVRGF